MHQDLGQMSPPFVFDHELHDHEMSIHQNHVNLNPHDPAMNLDHMSPPLLSPSIAGNPTTPHYNHSPMNAFFVMPDGSHSQNIKPARRRRSAGGSDTVKHRRTRSGCFTCRTRRVKVGFRF